MSTKLNDLLYRFGYIEYTDVASAGKAIENMHRQVFEGRRMAVQYATHSKRPKRPYLAGAVSPSKTLFIGNMSFEMSDQDLNDLFGEIKNVLDVRVAIDRRSGQPRGFAHADFVDVSSAERAKKLLENKEVFGRMLRVDFSKATNSREVDAVSSEERDATVF